MNTTEDKAHGRNIVPESCESIVCGDHECTCKDYQHNIGIMLDTISHFGIWMEANTDILHWSKGAERILGMPSTCTEGKPLKECGIKWDWNRIHQCLENCRETQKAEHLENISFEDGEGNTVRLNLTLMPDMNRQGSNAGFILLGHEVTREKVVEEQLFHLLRSSFLSHLTMGAMKEINTPIQYMVDNVNFLQEVFEDLELLLARYQGLYEAVKHGKVNQELVDHVEAAMEKADLDYLEDEVPKAIEQTAEGLAKVTKIVESMKSLSFSDTDEKISVDINATIENITNVLISKWRYHADVVIDLDPKNPFVHCHPGELSLAILNVIDNALDAIANGGGEDPDEKGTIKISSQCKGTDLEIRILDTGPGIPDEDRSRIFSPFFTNKGGGTNQGHGLKIARSIIVDNHGGRLDFESISDVGTTFIINLPIGDRKGHV